MTVIGAQIILSLFGLYLLVGLVIGIPFVVSGVRRVDHAAEAGTWGFRVIVLPGVVALWPVVLRKWLQSKRGHRSS